VAYISNNNTVKQCLFPPCGQNPLTANGGGKPKTTAHWDIASSFLIKYPEYAPAIQWILAHLNAAKECTQWQNKIKN
jgi:hypothetical protein